MSFKTNTTTTKKQFVSATDLRKKALCIGINDYPGTANDLKGCVNDALDWKDFLASTYGYSVKTLINSEATKTNFLREFENLIVNANAGHHIVITNSSHGTNTKDYNGDEEDGRDEALCLYDGLLIDDEIRDIISKLNPEAKLTFISDSCHSGSVTRAFLFAMSDVETAPIPRYLPPEDEEEIASISAKNITGKILYPEANMKEILISGCLPTEYSYDASFNNRPNGAFTYYSINILRANPFITYNEFYKKLREKMPSNSYPQTPQLESNPINKDLLMFQ